MTTRKFNIERDTEYLPEQCPVTKKWSATRLALKMTWTVYETVGSPAYQTPVFTGTREQADAFIKGVKV